MRIAATADFHGRGFPEVPPCDLLLIAGDWSPVDVNYRPAHPVLLFDYDGERISPVAA